MQIQHHNILNRVTQGRSFIGVGLRVALATSLSCCAFALTGCKPSSVLTELFYKQDQEKIDEDNVSKMLNNTLTSLNLTEDMPELKREETELQREVEETEAVKDDEPNSKQEVSDSTPEENAVSKSETHKKKKKKKKKTESTTKDGKDTGTAGGNGDGSGGEGDGTVYRGNGGTGATYGSDGEYSELPTGVQTVVAFGECANMVVSFAGEHALMGADKTFLSSTFIKKAYASKDIANVKTISSDKKGVVDAKAIAKLGPDAVLLSGTDYSISSSGLKALEEAQIDVVYMPAMNSASNIVEAARELGEMFGSDTLSGDDAGKAAKEYIQWHEDVLKETNKGKVAGTYDYDKDDAIDGTKCNYTIYVDRWDSCTYYATPDGIKSWTDKNGVAIAKAGYKWSPMSYYLSTGGTQNNAALFKKSHYDTSALYYVWQFNLGRVPAVYSKNWSGRSEAVSKLNNSGVDDLLVTTSDGSKLGDSNFSYVIARTKQIATKLEYSNSLKNKGLYGVYSSVNGNDGGGRGFLSGSGHYCSAAISGKFDVLVNPCGLYSSWIDGSPESVLESVWIDDINTGNSNLNTRIKEYYELFYDVKLTDKQLKTITSGLEK